MRSSEPETLILISLLEGPKHGYAIGDDLKEMTGRRPGPGTLYGAVARLEEAGLVVQRASRDRRKPYGLTRPGLERATAEVEKLEEIAKVGRKRLRIREAT